MTDVGLQDILYLPPEDSAEASLALQKAKETVETISSALVSIASEFRPQRSILGNIFGAFGTL